MFRLLYQGYRPISAIWYQTTTERMSLSLRIEDGLNISLQVYVLQSKKWKIAIIVDTYFNQKPQVPDKIKFDQFRCGAVFQVVSDCLKIMICRNVGFQ